MRRAPDYQELLKRGYGHIGRVGYLSPGIVDETLSGQFYRMAPPGVTLVRTSLELKDVTIAAAVRRTSMVRRRTWGEMTDSRWNWRWS